MMPLSNVMNDFVDSIQLFTSWKDQIIVTNRKTTMILIKETKNCSNNK